MVVNGFVFSQKDTAVYTAATLNQYTAIQLGSEENSGVFTPTYDSDGNQTLVKASTGIWPVTCNAENCPMTFCPMTFDNNESNTVVDVDGRTRCDGK